MKLALAALSLSAVSIAPRSDLRFAAEKGLALHRTFSEATTWSLVSMEEVIDGNSSPVEGPEMSGETARRLEVIDTCHSVEGGVATQLAREFETVEAQANLEFRAPNGGLAMKVPMASELDDASVLFERKSATSEPVAKFAAQAKGGSTTLVGLREDLDLRALVAEEGVAEGDWWKVDAATLADVLAPGGDLALLPSSGSVRPEYLQFFDASEVIGTTFCSIADNVGELAGEVLCTWKETKKDGEREIAVIELEWDSTSRTEQSDVLKRRLAASGAKTNRTDLSVVFSTKSEGKGQLLWDLKAHHALSLELQLDTHFDSRFDYADPSGDGGYHFVLSAKSELKAEFEAK